MELAEAVARLEASRSAVLGTADPDRGVHLVPVVFTVVDDQRIVIAVDSKPKRSRRLRRLVNIETDPRVSLLVEQYEEDWNLLWWVRVDGRARVVEDIGDDVERRHRQRYPQLDGHTLGPWIDIEVKAITGWAAG